MLWYNTIFYSSNKEKMTYNSWLLFYQEEGEQQSGGLKSFWRVFFTLAAVLAEQETFSDIWTSRNLKDCTCSTIPRLYCGAGVELSFLVRSCISSLVLVVFKTRLLTPHWQSISSLYAKSSPSEMSPTTVKSSANFVMVFNEWTGVVMGVQCVNGWTQHTVFRGPSIHCDGRGQV